MLLWQKKDHLAFEKPASLFSFVDQAQPGVKSKGV